MKNKKHWKFNGVTKDYNGIILRQIVLTIDCQWGTAGTVGGWIEKESNLQDNAWVSEDARVSGNAWVYGHAMVSDNARVFGDAWVFGNARVYEND